MVDALHPLALYGLAFVCPLAATYALTPLAARLALRLGMLDHPSPTKFHRETTPRLGGAAVAAGLMAVGVVAAGASGELLTVLLCGLALGLVGLLDDRGAVGPAVKLAVEIAAGVALWLAGIRAGLFHVYVLDLALTVFWVVAVTNAVNMLDNMDGLSSGVAAIAALTFFLVAAERGDYLVGALAAAVAGASLGFLPHNFPPARIFLGDAGTLLVGFLLAALGLKLDLVGENGLIRSAVPVLALGVPIFDASLVIIARLRDRRPIYLGGTDHSSHRLAALGVSTRGVALVVYGTQLASAAFALLLLRAPARAGLVAVILIGGLAAMGLMGLLALPPAGEAGPARHHPVGSGSRLSSLRS